MMHTKTVVCPHSGIPFSTEKEILPFATTWMNLERIVLSERRQGK
jgi:hypothetical protein